MPFSIGPYQFAAPYMLSPMAGVSDLPFRNICRDMGAALATSEMLTAEQRLWNSKKSQTRLPNKNERGVRSIQILGTDPQQMAAAAERAVELGAQIIDINMGCPAKKVCNRFAGSALMQVPETVRDILRTVVASVDVPVTLKIRTGIDAGNKNATYIAQLAEQTGVQAIAVHGRTRAQKFTGHAEYESIRQVKQAVHIPVFANGDVADENAAKFILEYSQADGVLIGRAARGAPWLFKQLNETTELRNKLEDVPLAVKVDVILNHIAAMHDYYGNKDGVLHARKHLAWYVKTTITWIKPDQYIDLMQKKCAQSQMDTLNHVINV